MASTTRRKWTEAEIKAFIDDGWYFRKKKSMGRDYITRRKGQNERSLGPFDEDLWDLIIRTRVDMTSEKASPMTELKLDSIQSEKMDDYLNRYDLLTNRISIERAVHLMLTCTYKGEDGFCSFWSWSVQPPFYELASELGLESDFSTREVTDDNGSKRKWFVRALPWFCESCPVYVARQRVS